MQVVDSENNLDNIETGSLKFKKKMRKKDLLVFSKVFSLLEQVEKFTTRAVFKSKV